MSYGRHLVIRALPGTGAEELARALRERGAWTRALAGAGETSLLVLPGSAELDVEELAALPGVAAVLQDRSPHPLLDAHTGHVTVAGRAVGCGRPPALFAGPCSVESREHALEVAERVAAVGATLLRGGAYKPRSSPYAFAGHGEAALGWLREAADRSGLGVVTEAVSEADVPRVAEHADLLQVGSRNMHSPGLLRAAGRAGRPVLLKRGMSATIEEWLLAAERLLLEGAPGVILCERGVRSFDPSTRNVLDLGAVALLAGVRGLPVVVDPSHAAGRRDLVLPLARAALAAGAAGVLVEVHPRPADARSDGPQALLPEELAGLLVHAPVSTLPLGGDDESLREKGQEPAAGAGRQ